MTLALIQNICASYMGIKIQLQMFKLKKMEIELKNLEAGNKVWCGGDSGFCHDDIEKVEKVDYKFDKDTGEKYKIIILSDDRKFDSRNGKALTPPTAYYLMAIEQ